VANGLLVVNDLSVANDLLVVNDLSVANDLLGVNDLSVAYDLLVVGVVDGQNNPNFQLQNIHVGIHGGSRHSVRAAFPKLWSADPWGSVRL